MDIPPTCSCPAPGGILTAIPAGDISRDDSGASTCCTLNRNTGSASGRYEYIQPGYGLGIRISLNKFSRTNLCLDYGWGSHGSGGFFVNLGEVF